MRGMSYTRATRSAPTPRVDAIVAEALAKQAAARPAKTPPKPMSVTPTLPKAGKRRRQRRRSPGK
ncbi:MAG TPA: hypothetical protein VGI81_23690 [Tepidisphaeraceae bacterium]|jgi:hypothetical protein